MKEEKENIKTEPQKTDNDSLSVVEAQVMLKGKMLVNECSWESLKHLMLYYHYLHRMPAGILACYGLYESEHALLPIGGIVYTNGRVQYTNKFIEFARMYLYDEVPKNAESYFIGQTLKLLKKKYPNYLGVVTWADPKLNHDGTVYKASNFIYDGESRKTKKFKSNTGKTIYQRTVLDESSLHFLGFDDPKKRFIYYFDAKVREAKRHNKRAFTA